MDELYEKAALIRLLVLDVDGVMTDGKLHINDQGEETKSFDVKDGLGIKSLMRSGIQVAIITARKSRAVEYRAQDLGLKNCFQGSEDKGNILKGLMRDMGLESNQVCCMGDDLPDISMFRYAGLSVAVADACPEARDAADYVTNKPGGHGAIREAAELILKAQGKWQGILSGLTNEGK